MINRIPNKSVESYSKRDYFRTAVEEFEPDTIFVQSEPTNFFSQRNIISNGVEKDYEKLTTIRSINDCRIDYKEFDKILAQGFKDEAEDAEKAQRKGVKDFGYKFETNLLSDIEPQMLGKLTDYDDAFKALQTNEDLRTNPKMADLKKIHDIIHYIRRILWGGNIENLHFDISSHAVRSIIHRSDLVFGEYPEVLFRRYLDRSLSLPKLEKMYKIILSNLTHPDYDDLKGKSESSTLTLGGAIEEFPEHFVLPKTLF